MKRNIFSVLGVLFVLGACAGVCQVHIASSRGELQHLGGLCSVAALGLGLLKNI